MVLASGRRASSWFLSEALWKTGMIAFRRTPPSAFQSTDPHVVFVSAVSFRLRDALQCRSSNTIKFSPTLHSVQTRRPATTFTTFTTTTMTVREGLERSATHWLEACCKWCLACERRSSKSPRFHQNVFATSSACRFIAHPLLFKGQPAFCTRHSALGARGTRDLPSESHCLLDAGRCSQELLTDVQERSTRSNFSFRGIDGSGLFRMFLRTGVFAQIVCSIEPTLTVR